MTKNALLSLLLIVLFTSCKKESEIYESASLDDYFPLQVGKYITYDLDSTVFVNFGKVRQVVSYQVKDMVDAKITDNLGRPSYRIIRYSRKTASDPWIANNTFMATPTDKSMEFVENNLRYIKLILPVKADNSWRGNSYIDTYTSGNDMRYLDNWDYIYDSVSMPLSIRSFNFENTIKVFHRDEDIGDPKIPGTGYAEKTYSLEKYAKGVGLIYREFLHWEYQGNTQSYDGYGVKLTVTDYN
ncbi:MAG: hypothetical protein ABIN48_05975 [Ginsengibacter sp.]